MTLGGRKPVRGSATCGGVQLGPLDTDSVASATLALFLLLFAQPAAVAQPATSTPQPQAASSAELEKRLLDIVEMFMSDPRYNRGKTPAQIKDSAEFVTGNVLFVLGHETAHALISEFGIPVLGREEDAADALAAIISLKMSNAFADRVVYNAARGWFLSDQRDRKQGIPNSFYDEHGMDLQRAYNIVCLMVGGAPDKFDKLANEVKLPEEPKSMPHCRSSARGSRSSSRSPGGCRRTLPGKSQSGSKCRNAARQAHDGTCKAKRSSSAMRSSASSCSSTAATDKWRWCRER